MQWFLTIFKVDFFWGCRFFYTYIWLKRKGLFVHGYNTMIFTYFWTFWMLTHLRISRIGCFLFFTFKIGNKVNYRKLYFILILIVQLNFNSLLSFGLINLFRFLDDRLIGLFIRIRLFRRRSRRNRFKLHFILRLSLILTNCIPMNKRLPFSILRKIQTLLRILRR